MNLNGTFSCACRPGFTLEDDGKSGVCKANDPKVSVIYSNGEDIDAYQIHRKREVEVIRKEKHIEAIDYNPVSETVFWVDSSDKKIKRSYMVDAMGGSVKTGFPQDLTTKGTAISTCSVWNSKAAVFFFKFMQLFE